MKDDDGADEYSAPRGHLTVGRRSSAAVEERERQRESERERMRRVEGLNTSVVGRGAVHAPEPGLLPAVKAA